jgi:hypothetical protein
MGRLAFTLAIDPEFVRHLLSRHSYSSIADVGVERADSQNP